MVQATRRDQQARECRMRGNRTPSLPLWPGSFFAHEGRKVSNPGEIALKHEHISSEKSVQSADLLTQNQTARGSRARMESGRKGPADKW